MQFEFAVVVGAGAFGDAGHGVDEFAGEIGEQHRFGFGFVLFLDLDPPWSGTHPSAQPWRGIQFLGQWWSAAST
ncbi:hypothetical protein ACFWTE_05845 [Nocardiopsis sp. NPDC058631]|uniref:hypothetical protein n=1 Tax=Nocardiopsis sp. NPDC058631 TaxID=3346566 RepID=UPI00364A6F5A